MTEKKLTVEAAVDELGTNRAQQAALEEREEFLRDFIKDNTSPEDNRVLAEMFEAVRVDMDRNQTSWKKVAMHFNPSRQLITAHTTTTPVVQIRTNVRKDIVLEMQS